MSSYQIPFNAETGHQLDYADSWVRGGVELKDNYEFEDTLTFKTAERGRSACHSIWVGSDGKEYTMFLTYWKQVMPRVVNSQITGRFTFIKRGQNFSVVPL